MQRKLPTAAKAEQLIIGKITNRYFDDHQARIASLIKEKIEGEDLTRGICLVVIFS
jgi:hypothetical protein